MKTIRFMLLACLTATAAAPDTATRGFDCAKAGGQGGKLVCSGEPMGTRPDAQPLGLVRLQNSSYSGFEGLQGAV